LRYDGYYILADLVEVPNLRQQSGSVIKQWLGRFFLDTELENPRVVPERGRGWLAAYGVASAIYRWMVVFAILWFVHSVLKPYRLEVLARLLAVIVVGGMLIAPVVRAVKFLRDPVRSRDMNWSRLLTRGGLVAVALLAFGLIPFPRRVTVPVVIEPRDSRPLYVSVGGTLVESTRPGERVQTGQTVGVLENLEIAQEIAELRGQLEEQERLVENLRSRSLAGDASAGDQIPTAREVLADLEIRLKQRLLDEQRLQLTAPIAGTVLPPKYADRRPPEGQLGSWTGTPLDAENVGTYLEAGTTYCLIGDPRRLEAVLVVDQADVQFVREGQRVRILLDETPGQSLWGKVSQISAMDLKVAPRELARHESLPTRPDEAGTPRPVSPSYQVRVELEPHQTPLLIGASGDAKIHVEPQSLLGRLARYLSRTFRLEF
jgi:putative peptide zinc metalloprotease protein